MTGHDNGLITIKLAEADDAEREKRRAAMGEPYRTLLGHFRHEVGHYYWDRLVRDGGASTPAGRCSATTARTTARRSSGITRKARPPDWLELFISAYATAHPWEDFAETWAHYLHIVDTLEMAGAFGVRVDPKLDHSGELEASVDFDPYTAGDVQQLIDAWLPLTFALNSLNRGMGQADLYPFVLSPAVVEKLGFIHHLTSMRGGADVPNGWLAISFVATRCNGAAFRLRGPSASAFGLVNPRKVFDRFFDRPAGLAGRTETKRKAWSGSPVNARSSANSKNRVANPRARLTLWSFMTITIIKLMQRPCIERARIGVRSAAASATSRTRAGATTAPCLGRNAELRVSADPRLARFWSATRTSQPPPAASCWRVWRCAPCRIVGPSQALACLRIQHMTRLPDRPRWRADARRPIPAHGRLTTNSVPAILP